MANQKIQVERHKAEYLRGFIEGIMIAGETSDFELLMGALEKLQKRYNQLIDEGTEESGEPKTS